MSLEKSRRRLMLHLIRLECAPLLGSTGEAGEPAGVWFWCWVFGVSGLIAVSLEVAWFRIVGVSSQYTSYVFGVTLGVFLLAILNLERGQVSWKGRRFSTR